jgi:hypothetical protein
MNIDKSNTRTADNAEYKIAAKTYHLQRPEYEQLLELYKEAKPKTIETIGNRIKRIFGLMHDSVYLSVFTNGSYLQLHKMNSIDFTRLLLLVDSQSIDSKKQLALTLQKLAHIYRCEAILTSPDVVQHMQFLIEETDKARKERTVNETWTNIIARVNSILTTGAQTQSGDYNPLILFCLFMKYAPPMRISDYVSCEISKSASADIKNYYNIDSGEMTIGDHKAFRQFANVYRGNGVRKITVAREIQQYIRDKCADRKFIFTNRLGKHYSPTSFSAMISVVLDDITYNDLRRVYIRDVVAALKSNRDRMAQLYVMGKTDMNI